MSRIGIVGAGQLGMMLGEAAGAVGAECRFLDPGNSPPAARVGDVIQGDYDDAAKLGELAEWADVITYEFENVPVDAVAAVTDRCPVYPPPLALEKAQDRLEEKQLFDSLGIPTSPFRNVESEAELERAVDELGLPLVFKTRRFGYDGKGQAVVKVESGLQGLWQSLGEVPLIAEKFVDFDREVSIIGTRSVSGSVAHYPLSENAHREGILRVSTAPYDDDRLHRLAVDYHERMLEALDYVGTLTLDLFVVGNALVANEFAPRVHNSGHWSIEGAACSQFENHLRAVLDQPLGDPVPNGHVAMINVIGKMPDGLSAPGLPAYYLHDYGKSPRAGRKLAHLTLVRDGRDELISDLEELNQVVNSD